MNKGCISLHAHKRYNEFTLQIHYEHVSLSSHTHLKIRLLSYMLTLKHVYMLLQKEKNLFSCTDIQYERKEIFKSIEIMEEQRNKTMLLL